MLEQRRDPTLGTWCVVSSERGGRPILLRTPALAQVSPQDCPFCPGHEDRTTPTIASLPAGEDWRVRAFANLYPALRVEGQPWRLAEGPWDRADGVGAHEVIAESRSHDRPLWMQPGQQALALQLVARRMRDLAKDTRLVHLTWFRNHGALAGASQPHPHSQIVGSTVVPALVAEMVRRAEHHREERGRALLDDIRQHERGGVREVWRADGVVAFCAFAPRFSFETWIVPDQGGPRMRDASDALLEAVGAALDRVLTGISDALDQPAYNVVLYEAPAGGEVGFRWHLRVMPRLVAPAGFEVMGGGTVLHVAPEEAAAVLREAMA